MLLHHEVIVAASSGLSLSALTWGAFAINAAAYYLRRLRNWRKKMPCYSRQTSTVQFGEQTDRALFQKALEALGYSVTVQKDGTLAFQKYDNATYALDSGTFNMQGALTMTSANELDINVFKRAYSTEVVKSAAQRFGWQAKQVGSAANTTTFQVQRRY